MQPEERNEPTGAGCRPAFSILWAAHAPVSAGADALAAAHPFSGSGAVITLYQDRIEQWLAQHPDAQSVGLAYVLAHELAHVMQALEHHSDSGILKTHWSSADFYRMTCHKLAFTASDVALIRNGLESRTSGWLAHQ